MDKRWRIISVFSLVCLVSRAFGYVAYVELELLSFRVLDRDTISEGTKCDDDHVNGAWNLCDFVFYVRNCSRIGTTYDCTTRINRFYAPENTDFVVFDYPRPATGVTIESAPKEMVFNITVFDQDDGRSADDFVGNYLLRVTPDLIFRQDSRLVGMTEQLITIPRHSEMKLRWRAYCGDTECRNYQGGYSQSSGLELGIGDNRWTGSALVNQINYRGEQPVGQFPLNPAAGGGFIPNQGLVPISGPNPVLVPPLIPVPNLGQIQIPPIQGPQFPVNNLVPVPNQGRLLFPRETPKETIVNPEPPEKENRKTAEDQFIPIHWRNSSNPLISPHDRSANVKLNEQSTPTNEEITKSMKEHSEHPKEEQSEHNKEEHLEHTQEVHQQEHETKWSDLTPERIDATYKKESDEPLKS